MFNIRKTHVAQLPFVSGYSFSLISRETKFGPTKKCILQWLDFMKTLEKPGMSWVAFIGFTTVGRWPRKCLHKIFSSYKLLMSSLPSWLRVVTLVHLRFLERRAGTFFRQNFYITMSIVSHIQPFEEYQLHWKLLVILQWAHVSFLVKFPEN